MDIDNISFGKNIRQKRKEQNITLGKLAEKCNMSENFLGNIERGTDIPSLKSFLKICNALNINADNLLFESLSIYTKNTSESYQLKIAKEITNLSSEQQKKIYELILTIKNF